MKALQRAVELTAFFDDFSDNRNDWEIVENADESARLEDGLYVMENRCDGDWHYFDRACPGMDHIDWKLETVFKWKADGDMNHFGLVWGFEDRLDKLNRFSLSADGESATVMSFQKDHHRVYHRYNARGLRLGSDGIIRMTIFKRGNYYHFLINEQLIYVCHRDHFIAAGERFGFYIEPQLEVRSGWIKWQPLGTSSTYWNNHYDRLDAE
jgi:hypothetical protein